MLKNITLLKPTPLGSGRAGNPPSRASFAITTKQLRIMEKSHLPTKERRDVVVIPFRHENEGHR